MNPFDLFIFLFDYFVCGPLLIILNQVLLQMGGEHACQLLSILEATFDHFPEYSGSERKNNSRGTCTIRLDWLRKPQRMTFSSQPRDTNLVFSSFRLIDFAFYSILNLPTEAEVTFYIVVVLHTIQSFTFNFRYPLKLWMYSCSDVTAL
jgi:hypothetical protein